MWGCLHLRARSRCKDCKRRRAELAAGTLLPSAQCKRAARHVMHQCSRLMRSSDANKPSRAVCLLANASAHGHMQQRTVAHALADFYIRSVAYDRNGHGQTA